VTPPEQYTGMTVIIPAYNAEKTLSTLLDRVITIVPSSSVIVVNDGSTDGTAAIASRFKTVVLNHKTNRGKGAALVSGFNAVRSDPTIGFAITMDADLQHRPEDIHALVQGKKDYDADIVVGVRKRVGSGMPFHRMLSNSITSTLVSIRTGRIIRDSQCGFRLIARKALCDIELESDGFEAETEFLIKAARRGFKIAFVPVQTIYDGQGSHMRHWETTRNFMKVLFRDY